MPVTSMTASELPLPATGASIPGITHCPDSIQLFLFGSVCWMPHRIHFDPEYARSEGHRDVLVHGALQGAYLSNFAQDWAEAGGARLVIIRYRHHAPAYVRDELTVTAQIASIDAAKDEVRIALQLTNGEGVVTTSGEATVSFPAMSAS